MAFADDLVSTPRRETSGATSYERFDYQASWGLALIFESHNLSDDYAIAFEFHDDIVRLDSSSSPTSAAFYQVKTRAKGHWTITDLSRQAFSKDGLTKLPSFIGKMHENYEMFPNHTSRVSFVSNLPCSFIDVSATEMCFASCDATVFADLLAKLKAEKPLATEQTAQLMHYVRATLSLNDASTHLMGKMQEFVTANVGSVTYNPDTLYKTIIEECRTKSKYTGSINTFRDLIKRKSITKAQVTGWLALAAQFGALRTWSSISVELNYGALQKTELEKDWNRYRTLALGAGDEAINRVRDKIRSELGTSDQTLMLTPLVEAIVIKVQQFAQTTISGIKTTRLRIMIIYEVVTHDPSGNVQAASPQSANPQS